MKKWLFSVEGKVTGPLTEDDAKKFVEANLEAYAWHPSYSHWMPVNCVKEFEELIPAPKPPSIIPKELIEEYIGKERALVNRLEKLDAVLAEADTEMTELHEEIVTFKKYTQNSNEELQATLRAIEEQFANLSKSLSGFKAKTSAGKEELSTVKKEFNERLEKDQQAIDSKESADFLVKAEAKAAQKIAQAAVDEKAKDVEKEELAAKAKAEADEKSKREAEAKAKAEADEKAKREAEAKAKAEADEKAKREAEAKAKAEAKEKAKREAEEKAIALKFKSAAEPVAESKPRKATVTKIEFSDTPSPEDILLASQLKPLDKPITPETPEVAEPISKVVGEFDHILYETLDEKVDIDLDDKAKKRLRRRRRR